MATKKKAAVAIKKKAAKPARKRGGLKPMHDDDHDDLTPAEEPKAEEPEAEELVEEPAPARELTPNEKIRLHLGN